jgi:hypothetical protein
LRALQVLGLKNSEAPRSREALHWAGNEAQAATGGTVGLCQDQGDLVARCRDARQGALGELRRASED